MAIPLPVKRSANVIATAGSLCHIAGRQRRPPRSASLAWKRWSAFFLAVYHVPIGAQTSGLRVSMCPRVSGSLPVARGATWCETVAQPTEPWWRHVLLDRWPIGGRRRAQRLGRHVECLCHRVGVMYLGKLVEVGSAEALCSRPRHPDTATLIAAAPRRSARRHSPSLSWEKCLTPSTPRAAAPSIPAVPMSCPNVASMSRR